MKLRFGMMILLAGLTAACGVVSVEFQTPAPATAPLAQATDATLPAPTAEPAIEPTATPAPTKTPAPPSATPTPSPLPTDTPLPTETPTPTPAYAGVTVSENLNVRSGPGTNYARVGLLAAGQTALIMGRTAEGDWWQIDYPDASNGLGWISAAYGEARFTEAVPVADAPPTPTPAVPTPTPSPTVPPVDFVVKSVRLWSNEENGGISPNGSVTNCGYGHNLFVTVLDAAGNPLDGVVLEDTYKTLRQITGSRGPGRAEYIFWSNGYQLLVIEDHSAGRAVTSQISPLASPKDDEIPIDWLIEGHYCATRAECEERVSKNELCRGHYSFDVMFQRTW